MSELLVLSGVLLGSFILYSVLFTDDVDDDDDGPDDGIMQPIYLPTS